MKIRHEQKYLLYLIDCILNAKTPMLPENTFDWEWLAKYAEEQQFEQIIYTVFDGKNPGFDADTWFHLEQRYGLSITRDAELEMAAGEIYGILSQNGIVHLPLKGGELKKYYPLPEIRSSFDIDILIHEEDMERTCKILENAGYIAEDLVSRVHYTFSKEKIHIELHRYLMNDYSTGYDFSLKVWEYSRQKDKCTYVMENEFFYIYLLEHLRKHITNGGAGLKLIIDFYVLKNMSVDLDRLNGFLKESNLTTLNECVNLLIEKWFADKKTDNINVLLIEQLILNTSAYGDYDVGMKMKYSEADAKKFNSKKRILAHAFPNLKYMQIRFPILKKCPWMLPITWIIRWIIRPKVNAMNFVSAMKDFTKEEAHTINTFLNDISK